MTQVKLIKNLAKGSLIQDDVSKYKLKPTSMKRNLNYKNGGHVDMHVPTNNEGEFVYQYDVNSLYPVAMKEYK